jgi:hypothetical protein
VMKWPRSKGMQAVLACVGVLALRSVGWACAVCVGNPDDPQTIGMNQAILGLLAITGVVLTGFSALFITLWRRGRNATDPAGEYVSGLEDKFSKEEASV